MQKRPGLPGRFLFFTVIARSNATKQSMAQ
jgi:hypothetical protein